MDALRRAEAANSAPRTDDTQPAAGPVSVDLPASNTPLELQPLGTPLSDIPDDATTANEANAAAAVSPAETSDAPVRTQRQAQAAVGTFAARKSSVRKHVLFVLSGLTTVAAILAGYYFWTTPGLAVNAAPQSPTFIDSPPPSSVPKSVETVTESITTATADTVESVATKPGAASSETAASIQSATTPPASSNAHNEPAPATQPYRIEIHKGHRPVTVPPALQQAYRAYREQDYQRAEQLYGEVLRTYPSNRDAMLGLAAIAVHEGKRQVAHHYYERLLKNDPSDKAALLGLQGLSDEQYSLEEGSKIKYWLQSDANNAQLHFALGNQYAASGQWKEAQQAYFDAHRIEPASADYAFNLAVSLDQLGMSSQALDYYRRARGLAEQGGALFSRQQLDRRIEQLAGSAEQGR
jgi:TolA-binding protein